MKVLILSSRTGSDAIYLYKKLPNIDFIFASNNIDSPLISFSKKNNIPIFLLSQKPTLKEYENLFEKNSPDIVLLTGYLRIIPEKICKNYNIYNLHPANILLYPHLKGFNPQKRALEEKLKTTGNTIHKVTEEVDCGTIIKTSIVPIYKNDDLETLCVRLGNNAKELWREFLKEIEE